MIIGNPGKVEDEKPSSQSWVAANAGVDFGSEEFKLSFGKYKGMTVAEVYKIDRNYFNWLLKSGRNQSLVNECREVAT